VVLVAALLVSQEGAARADEAWDRYHLAFLTLAKGDRVSARRMLEEVVSRHPAHPAAAIARQRIGELDAYDAGLPVEPEPPTDEDQEADPLHAERPTKLARAELILFQTVHGASLGFEVCALVGCDGARAHAAALMTGAGGGAALAWFLTIGGITPGHAELLDSGTTWGAWNGLAIVDASADDFDDLDEQAIAGIFVVAQLAGTAGAELVWWQLRPTSGQVATANTVGFWTVVVTALAHGAAQEEPSFITLALAGDVGLFVGAMLARRAPMSRGRSYLVDAGGVVGFLVGLLVASGMDDAAPAFSSMLVGTSLGLGAAVLLTREWDIPPPPKGTTVTPFPVQGGGLGAMLVVPLDL
jgi:hypothetical protein